MILKNHLFLKVSILATACLGLNACAKEVTIPVTGAKIECVGRSEIELPGGVDFALNDIKKMIHNDGEGEHFVFSDGDRFYGYIRFNGYQVTRIGPESDYKKYMDLQVSGWKKFYAKAVSKSEKKAHLLKYPPPEKIERQSLISIGPYGATFLTYRDNRIYEIGEEDYSKTQSGKEIAAYFVKNFMPRKAYETPSETGYCFPFGFMKVDGRTSYLVSVGMRLVDHPDVEIVFQDGYAGKNEIDRREEYTGSRGNVEYFWSHYGPSDGNLLDGTINNYHDVDLSGYTGQYATATIARPFSTPSKHGYDEPEEKYAARVQRGIVEKIYRVNMPPAFETQKQRSTRVKREIAEGKYQLDYGYMAYYKGDPDKPGEPEFMLSVIRTASRATAVGKTPVTQEELYAMAKKIAASIKRRPVQ